MEHVYIFVIVFILILVLSIVWYKKKQVEGLSIVSGYRQNMYGGREAIRKGTYGGYGGYGGYYGGYRRYCSNCGYLGRHGCSKCTNCGICTNADGIQECVSGDSSGPYFRRDCIGWEYGSNAFPNRGYYRPRIGRSSLNSTDIRFNGRHVDRFNNRHNYYHRNYLL